MVCDRVFRIILSRSWRKLRLNETCVTHKRAAKDLGRYSFGVECEEIFQLPSQYRLHCTKPTSKELSSGVSGFWLAVM